ncbi:hypothetical protein ACPCTG_31735 [Streptomyces pseudogriseolus]|uniref:hypothetical protein n=1 Tax=Streptomyces pseudogriseolus TaxID=36817 RepID=UPI003FA2319F
MTTHQFEEAPYTQLQHGDRVKIAQTYNGTLTGWWWPILTVDRVDWIRDDRTALMLYLTDPLPCGDRFVLIAGQAMVDAGVRRVIETPTPRRNPTVNSQSNLAETLDSVSPNAPMTHLALRIGLSASLGRPATEQEIDQTPTIPEGATRAEYAQALRNS